jgi:hypothetical protein
MSSPHLLLSLSVPPQLMTDIAAYDLRRSLSRVSYRLVMCRYRDMCRYGDMCRYRLVRIPPHPHLSTRVPYIYVYICIYVYTYLYIHMFLWGRMFGVAGFEAARACSVKRRVSSVKRRVSSAFNEPRVSSAFNDAACLLSFQVLPRVCCRGNCVRAWKLCG